MRIPRHIKFSIRILLIILILLLNILFITFFLSNAYYDDLAYKNGGWIYSILIFLLIRFQKGLKQDIKFENLKKLPQENRFQISNHDQWRIYIYAVLKKYMYYMIFGLIEIGLFFIVRGYNDKEIWELLYFGGAFFLTGLPEIFTFSILRKKQGFPRIEMDYKIINDKIEIVNKNSNISIKFIEIESTVKYDNMILVKTKREPRYLIFKLND